MKDKDLVLALEGPWSVTVRAGGPVARFEVTPAETEAVEREHYAGLPPFDAARPGWLRGERLLQCRSQETTVKDSLVPGTLHAETEDGKPLVEGADYVLDAEWAVIGRHPGGALAENQPVLLSYRFCRARLDMVVATADGGLALRRGEPHNCAPHPPRAAPGERVLANLWIPPRLERLRPEHLFPVLETQFPEPPALSPAAARRLLPETWRKLERGGPLRILAWGDSVTDAAYLRGAGFPAQRWQEQFVRRLRERFPHAAIELSTVAWGGHNSRHFLEAPATDAAHHYPTAVLGARPDLIISEFVNDMAFTDSGMVETLYDRFLADFHRIGAEWIIHSPHYVRPDWMALSSEREVDDDPRPYVAALRAFTARQGVPLTDASARWGRLWRQGLPYTTLFLNACNHPDDRGLALYADSLMRFFPAAEEN